MKGKMEERNNQNVLVKSVWEFYPFVRIFNQCVLRFYCHVLTLTIVWRTAVSTSIRDSSVRHVILASVAFVRAG